MHARRLSHGLGSFALLAWTLGALPASRPCAAAGDVLSVEDRMDLRIASSLMNAGDALLREADTHRDAEHMEAAGAAYGQALKLYRQLRRDYPEWQPQVVSNRLD